MAVTGQRRALAAYGYGGSLKLYVPYNADFVAELKQRIPPAQRAWDNDLKEWHVNAAWADEALACARNVWPDLDASLWRAKKPRHVEGQGVPPPGGHTAASWYEREQARLRQEQAERIQREADARERSRRAQQDSGYFRYGFPGAEDLGRPRFTHGQQQQRAAPPPPPPRPAPSSGPHAMLYVTSDAPPEVIRAAYKALAIKHHPDKGGSEVKMQQLNGAMDALKKAGKA